MSSDIAIKVENISKCYQVYRQPSDRLKQSIFPRISKLISRKPDKYYDEFWALKDVSFEIKRGETVGIVGRNGSGKSTLLQIICGTLNPSGGTIYTNGKVAALLELGSGFNPEFTGKENVHLNASVLGLSKEQIESRFDDIVRFADIGDFINHPVKTYSSGMMVRLAFAVIAHVDADILVIDEALAVGDAFFTQKCMRFLRNFMKSNTVVFVSHDTASVKSLCSRALWIEKGTLQLDGKAKEVTDEYLQAFYEDQQGKSVRNPTRAIKLEPRVVKDQRSAFINASNLRNDLKVFQFDPDAVSFGAGGAQIINVEFANSDGDPLAWIIGGEIVIVRISVKAHQKLDAPIVGFYLKDARGQFLFGDNTYISMRDSEVSALQSHGLSAEFTFQMPWLAPGNYSISAAVADGTQYDHIQHHWINDALLFKSECSSVSTGIIGIPMLDIRMTQLNLLP
jgi:lipopolysaccharide transport system ATP-binding protein